jgi:L-amino acid N-acyltransferase YncA
VATFETVPKTEAEVGELIASGAIVLVAELEGEVAGFVKVEPYDDPHDYYAGIGEATLYVERDARGTGVGTSLMLELARVAEQRGLHKLIGKIFSSNRASIALVERCGWRRVGLHRRHGRLEGEWKDVVLVELLLGPAAAGTPRAPGRRSTADGA